jgi:hypothetical protein
MNATGALLAGFTALTVLSAASVNTAAEHAIRVRPRADGRGPDRVWTDAGARR